MPEYDAFGREIGEDSLAALGWKPAPNPREHARPAPASPRAAASGADAGRTAQVAPPQGIGTQPRKPRAVSLPGVPRRRRRGRAFSRLILLVVVLAVAGNLVARAGHDVRDAVRGLPSLA